MGRWRRLFLFVLCKDGWHITALPFGMYKGLLRSMVLDEGAVVKKKTIVCSVGMSLRERLCSVKLGENRFMERSFFLLLRPLALPPC